MEWLLYIVVGVFFIGYCIFAWRKPAWGLLLLPFAIAALVMHGFFDENVFIITFAAFLFPVTVGLVRWAPSSSPLEMPWHKAIAKAVISVFQYLLILAILCYILNVFGGILFLLFIIGIITYTKTRKYALSLDILSAIGMSMRQSLPLPMALISAAHGQKPKEAKVFNDIAAWLTQGYPLSEAIRCGFSKCPPDILASITAAEKINQLPQAIETLQADLSEKISDLKQVKPIQPVYPLVVIFFAFNVLLGLLLFIVPVYAEVLYDMSDGQAGLPATTQLLLNMSMWLRGRHGLNIFLVLFSFMCLASLLIYIRFRRRNPQQPYLLHQIGDFLKWHFPIWHWFEKNRSQLQLTEALKIGLRAGYPVNTVLRNAMSLDMNHCYRSHILKWLSRIEQGENIARSAHQTGIGKMLAWALDEAVNKDSAPVILESLEEVYRSRHNYRLNLVNSILSPLMIIALASCVGFVVTAMFLPMVKMIEVLL